VVLPNARREIVKVIIVAGKYTSKSDWEKDQNIQKARAVARMLWYLGWAVICPHSNTSFFGDNEENDPGEREMWTQGVLELVSRSDAIYMMKGYEQSEGAKKELELAEELGLEVLFE
jgi:hypothetical protein